jgi:hypothetical protein
MRSAVMVGILLLAAVTVSLAAPPDYGSQPFPGTLRNAQYVYVRAYDGDQFNPNLLTEDRQAINSVQDAIQKWGRYILVYRPQDADIILMVQSRPSEDVLAVYDAKLWPEQTYLWRAMGRDGLQQGEVPLVTRLEKAVQKAEAKK